MIITEDDRNMGLHLGQTLIYGGASIANGTQSFNSWYLNLQFQNTNKM